MPHNFPTQIGLFLLTVGTIGITSQSLTACNTVAPPTAVSPTVGDHSMGGMDHSKMGGMGHNMDLGPADADYDLRFIDAMLPHHEGALVMAREVLQKSKRPELKKLAEGMIQAQTAEIAEMQQWRSAWYPKAPSSPVAWHAAMNGMMPMSDEQKQGMMMKMDLGAADDGFDLRFVNAMIPHHEGAVTMAQDLRQKSKRPELQKLGQAIVKSQTAEIQQMQQWQKAWAKP
jgi:uncharacterized protein (DUF305 family)